MILGIDAFNIRSGGGVTHLVELLRASEPISHGFEKVIIWGSKATLAKIDSQSWLVKVNDALLDRGLPYRIYWHMFKINKLAKVAGCNIIFVPGGLNGSGFKPYVTMSQNLLPFEWRELLRYGLSIKALKFLFLRWSQARTFRDADGVIFLTNYAESTVLKVVSELSGQSAIVPHGINPRFFSYPRLQRDFNDFSLNDPCRLLYVSIVDLYKHQWQVAKAVAQLRSKGFPITLDLVGPPAGGSPKLRECLNQVDPEGEFIKYRGAISYELLDEVYAEADIGIFASSCENLPNILLEGMAAGLPMACSDMGPMPEVLGQAGIYFNPEDLNSISGALRELIVSTELRKNIAQLSFDRAQVYSWTRCAHETFCFLEKIAKDSYMRGKF